MPLKPFNTTSNKETFLQVFLENLEEAIVIYLTSNLSPHIGVIPVAKGSIFSDVINRLPVFKIINIFKFTASNQKAKSCIRQYYYTMSIL